MNHHTRPPAATSDAAQGSTLTRGHRHALCPLIMVGDPTLAATRALLTRCTELGVPMVELCLPFRNAFTDGEALQSAHKRALANAVEFAAVMDLIAEFSNRISIILLADSSHTLRPLGIDYVLSAAAKAGVAAVLPHGLPPRLVAQFHDAAGFAKLPAVGTIYANSGVETRQGVLERARAFIYLVTTYGRSGGSADPNQLRCQIDALRSHTALPIALGFGLRTADDVAQAFSAGSDIAIVGSAVSAQIEAALTAGEDPVTRAGDFIATLQERAQH